MRIYPCIVSALVAVFLDPGLSNAAPAAQSGLISLGVLQTARLNVANLLPPGPEPVADACSVSLRFLDDAGAPFVTRTRQPVASVLSLPPGQSDGLELPAALAPRGLFRVVVEQTDSSRAPNPCAGIVVTLEVFDSLTGRTSVLEHLDAHDITDGPGLPHLDSREPADRRLRSGLSTPRFGVAGLARLQTASLHIVNLAPADRVTGDGCTVRMSFVDQVGAPFIARDGSAVVREARLSPGESSQLELPSDVAFGRTTGMRRTFRPVLDSIPGSAANSCAAVSATLEIVDSVTGRSNTVVTVGGTVDDALALANGAAISIADSVNGRQYFKIDVPAGANDLRFSMSGGSGDADLYVKFGSVPTLTSYDARPYLNGNNEMVDWPLTPAAGTWYVMVKAYQAYAGVSLVASFSDAPPPTSATDLTSGVPVTGLSGATSSAQYFRISVPAGRTTLVIKTSGGSGDAGLYVRYGNLPTTSQWNARPYLNGNTESTSFSSPTPGFWYVMIRGYNAYSGVTLTATFTPAAPDPGSADFLIVLSPVTPLVTSGSSTTVVVSTTTIQGGPQAIVLAVGGLPPNVVGTFSPATVTSGQNATLTLTAAANAVLGDKTFTVTGTTSVTTHQALATLSVVP